MNPDSIRFPQTSALSLPEWHKLLQGWLQTSAALASRGWAKQLAYR